MNALLVGVAFGLGLTLGAAPSVRPATLTAAEEKAIQTITAHELAADIRFLASDLLEGRGPGTRGDQLAQAYVASQFELLGLKPAGEQGGWYQPFQLVGITGKPDTLALRGKKGTLTLAYRQDFIAVSGAQKTSSALEDAEIVFVGYGIVAPEFQWDDYKGADLKGKVLLMMNNDPEDDPALFAGRTRLRYGRWDYKYEIAAKVGAAGAIIIHTTPSAGYPWQVVQTSWAGEQFELPEEPGHHLEVKAWVTEEKARALTALGGFDLDALRAQAQRRDFKPVPLDVTINASFQNRLRRITTANVLGVLPGSDVKLRDQWVVITAHHDHLGIQPGAAPGEDAIYNGAVDNASGVATMLAMARGLASLPKAPKRSILFAAVAAEEQGLLGSEYLARHPPRPPGALAANLNIDGINTLGRTADVTMIGLGKSDVDDLILPLAATQGRKVFPDQLPDRGYFYRSDQYNFAKIGVPVVYLGSGLDYRGRPPGWGKQMREKWEAEHYHQPSDEWDPGWDLSGAVEDAQLYLLITERIANAPKMPAWRKGDEFEAARLQALHAVEVPRAR
ncbi:MAG: M28 family peptidase [Myxococcaceae bacterium]|nr:M28 family peptidase [Myxococcaceae bacterium]